MATSALSWTATQPRVPFGWRWMSIAVAALAMVATLPGRTHGLGLFTEPILREFGLSRVDYGLMNLWGTLLGAAFCLPCGWLLDRFGTRTVLVGTMVLLAGSVFGLAAWTGGTTGLFLFILLTRGFGQSALSVGSLALVGRAAGVRSGWGMGVYACLTTLGFMAAFTVLRSVVLASPDDWRTPWAGIGGGVLVAAVVSGLLIRDHKRVHASHEPREEPSHTFGQALASPAFWVFAVGTAFYGMVAAGTSLFNESILAERGFPKTIFLNATVVGIPVGLVANLLGGWLAGRVALGRLFAVALALLAVTLLLFPRVVVEWQVYAYVVALAAAGGVITVCFFIVWRRAFGPAALGRIQGAAQLLTVLFSAAGPLLFAEAQSRLGQYALLFPWLAGTAFFLALYSWFTRITPYPRVTR
ncbi:MAG: MFS transporter [Bacteroidales bacterium]|nr:MFS transporter [Bacteroidales bacterium]